MTATDTRKIEVFRPGTFVPMSGAPVTMTAADLKAIAASYDAEASPTPVVIGHPKTEDQAWGWAKSFSFDEDSQKLVAEVGDIEPAFGEAVKKGSYKRISLSLFSPSAPNNPKPGAWYPKHIGFLGAAAPAVSGLKPVAFAEDQTGVVEVEFGDPAFKDVASLFRSMREFLIEKFGLEAADQATPSWSINWIDDAADRDRPGMPAFTEPQQTAETTMTEAEKAAQAERERELNEREARLAKREADAAQAENLSFAEGLVSEGRLLPASQPRVVALLNSLAAPAPTEVSFSEPGGEAVTESAAEAVRAILKAQPVVVNFGEFAAGHDKPGRATVAFASPDGRAVDAAGLQRLGKAQAYQKQHPEASLEQALAATAD
ncbi:hypothetical protein ABE438_14650 [Bosea sp. TWI1241]|uniref:hypothetical protein n=1 Tax=Bosea sp. TWI1241 TaxID=3148904 RepID=UPI0032079654